MASDKILDMEVENQQPEHQPVKRMVLDYDDIRAMAPFFDGKPRLVNWCMRFLSMDKVNWLHDHNCDVQGVPFVQGMLNDLDISIEFKNGSALERLPEGGFITVSNHPFGALDGIMLIKIIGEYRPDFKVMVNMVLNYIAAMRPNFVSVDAFASDDPKKRAESVRGLVTAMRHVKEGHPLGLFPAGAVSKFTSSLRIQDRKWQPTITRLVKKLKVPVVPIYFHGHNSVLFNLLGMIDWRLRTLRLPSEVFRRKGHTFRVSIGDPITPGEQERYATAEELGAFLRARTYAMKDWKS